MGTYIPPPSLPTLPLLPAPTTDGVFLPAPVDADEFVPVDLSQSQDAASAPASPPPPPGSSQRHHNRSQLSHTFNPLSLSGVAHHHQHPPTLPKRGREGEGGEESPRRAPSTPQSAPPATSPVIAPASPDPSYLHSQRSLASGRSAGSPREGLSAPPSPPAAPHPPDDGGGDDVAMGEPEKDRVAIAYDAAIVPEQARIQLWKERVAADRSGSGVGRVPSRPAVPPRPFVYDPGAVRGTEARAALFGHACPECAAFYAASTLTGPRADVQMLTSVLATLRKEGGAAFAHTLLLRVGNGSLPSKESLEVCDLLRVLRESVGGGGGAPVGGGCTHTAPSRGGAALKQAVSRHRGMQELSPDATPPSYGLVGLEASPLVAVADGGRARDEGLKRTDY